MFPVIFSLGPFTLYTISVFMVLTFLICSYVFWRKGREEHYMEDELFDAYLLSLFWGFIASRVGFILINLDHFGWHVDRWLDMFTYPGQLPLLGLVVGAIYLYSYSQKQKWDAFEILDFGAISMACGHAILWIGSFFDGSGFGNPTKMPWGMTFPSVFDKRHPTQLYAAILYFILFGYLLWVEPRYRTYSWYRDKKHSAQSGFLFSVFCICYGLFGLGLALLRPPQIVIANLSLDIPIRVVIFVTGFLLLMARSGRLALPKKKAPKPAPLA